MKILGFTVVLVVLFVMGYALQSSITPLLVKDNSLVIDMTRQVEVNGIKMEVDLKEMSEDDKPASLTLKDAIEMKSEDGSMIRSYQKGQSIELVSLTDKGQLEVADPADAKFSGKIDADKTDIYEELGKRKMAAIEANEAAVKAEIARVEQVKIDRAAKNPDPAVVPVPDTTVAENDPQGEEPMPEPGATSPQDPEPSTPATEPDPVIANNSTLAADKIVDVMKESIKGGAIKEFTFEQVDEWIAGEAEEVDGVSYQTGLASYKAETIFGVKAVQAKALIQDGKVKKWIYAKTGMQIR